MQFSRLLDRGAHCGSRTRLPIKGMAGGQCRKRHFLPFPMPTPGPGILRMDGIFVAEPVKGQGVGALLLTALKRKAR